MDPIALSTLRSTFPSQLKENVPLSGYTSARIGGPADALLILHSAEELVQAAKKLWELDLPFLVLGSGSNVLVSDRGVRGVVLINRARAVRFEPKAEPPVAEAESGATLNDLAHRAARLGLAGLEWAATVPGSLGGAVYGNAGAFDGDISGNLISIELFHRQAGRQTWSKEKLAYGYRTSLLKREHPPVVLLAARLALQHGDRASIQKKERQFSAQRHASQPAGASLGSMFKNPPGEFAGKLIERAGLKGQRIGNAEISPAHANFFINHGKTKADDILALIELTRKTVAEKSGLNLELEVELIGEWEGVHGH